MTAPSWPEVLCDLVAGHDIDAVASGWAMDQILGGEATAAQIAGFLIALRAKGETITELQGLVDAMYRRAVTLSVTERVVDVVGTGGDMAKTVNISSMAAVTVAGAGIGVIKHGNRASSSQTGTADVFEHLGVALDLSPEDVLAVYEDAHITFCFAPVFHPAMRFAGPVRRELGVPTTFNFLGPLANPARAQASAVGCADPVMAPLMAEVIDRRGGDVMVFRGDDGLDEITVSDTTSVWTVADGIARRDVLDPRELGFDRAPVGALAGGDPAHNADVFRRVLGAEPGPVRDAVLLNAAAAIAVHRAEPGTVAERIASALPMAVESIDSGAALAALERWAEATRKQRD